MPVQKNGQDERNRPSFPGCSGALSYLQELYELLEVYEVTKYVSFDWVSVLTVIIPVSYLAAIPSEAGEPIVKGGRYDRAFVLFWKRGSGDRFALR